jgi:hypothetical protein
MKVYKAISDVQAALSVRGIAKNRKTDSGSIYHFRGIDDVYNALAELLPKHGLCILPRVLNRTCAERVSASNKVLFYVTVEAEFDFVSVEDGSKHIVKTFGEAMDSSDKATNKAMSTAYKYACFQAFSIPTEAIDVEIDNHQVSGGPSLADLTPYLASMENARTHDELKTAYFAALKFAGGNIQLQNQILDLKDRKKAAI